MVFCLIIVLHMSILKAQLYLSTHGIDFIHDRWFNET